MKVVGHVLAIEGDPPGAIAHLRKAIALDKTIAIFHSNLVMILKEQGEFAEALEHFKTAHELGPKQADWPYDSIQWVNHTAELIEVEKQLPTFLAKKAQSKNPRDLSHLGQVCAYKKMNVAAVGFYQASFALSETQAKSHHAC